jgi:integrase
MTLGRYGPVTVEEARDRAMKLIGAVADGKDPANTLTEYRRSPTIADAAAEFLTEHVATKRKPTTEALYRHVVHGCIVPALGERKIRDLTKAEVSRYHNSMRSTPYLANRALAVLGSLYTWAGRRGLVAEEFNPTKRIEKFREARRERFLTSEELQRLGDTLREAETTGIPWEVDEEKPSAKHAPKEDKRFSVISPYAVAAVRLLLFTGCRLREILGLRWEHVDFERGLLLLSESKSGRKPIMLGAPALRILADLPPAGTYVIVGHDPEKPRTDLKRPWAAIRRRAKLAGVRIHDLRQNAESRKMPSDAT